MADEKEAAAAATEDNTLENSVVLRKAIQANGEEIKVLKFREPTGGDISRVGNPVNIDVFSDPGKPKTNFDEKKMEAMMALLAGVPPSSIKQLHPKDWNNCAWTLLPFFTPDL